MPDQYDTLVLSGGGIITLCELGGLQYLNEQKLIDNVSTYIATSAGAIIIYLLIIGYTPFELMAVVCKHPLFIGNFSPDINRLLNARALTTFTPFRELLESMTLNRAHKLFTMSQFRTRYNKNLIIPTYDYDLKEMVYISADTHPDIPCTIALTMTCAIPFVFGMFKYDGHRYMDPCITESCSVSPLTEEMNALVMMIEPQLVDDQEDSFSKFFHNLIFIPWNELLEYRLKSAKTRFDLVKFVEFPDSYSSIVEKMDLFSIGYKRVRYLFEIKPTELRFPAIEEIVETPEEDSQGCAEEQQEGLSESALLELMEVKKGRISSPISKMSSETTE